MRLHLTSLWYIKNLHLVSLSSLRVLQVILNDVIMYLYLMKRGYSVEVQ